jgi:anti-anti-sigma regulatory factor
VLRLEEEVDINFSVELKQALVEIIASGKELHLDLQSGPSLDVTAIQLLWSAKHEAELRGSHFGIVGDVPDNVTSVLHDAGFSSFLTSFEASFGEFAGSIQETAHDRQV